MQALTPTNVMAALQLAALLVQRASEALAIGEDISLEELAGYRAGDDASRASLQAKIDTARAARLQGNIDATRTTP